MVTEQETQKPFDLVVHQRDPKTGLVIKEDAYNLRVCDAGNGGRTRTYERPKGSGNLFEKSGKPCGRWVEGKYVEGAKHVVFVAPLTNDQKLAAENISNKARIAELELKLIEMEAKKKDKGA